MLYFDIVTAAHAVAEDFHIQSLSVADIREIRKALQDGRESFDKS